MHRPMHRPMQSSSSSGSLYERAEGAKESDGAPGDVAGRKAEALRRMETTRTKFDKLKSVGIAAEQVKEVGCMRGSGAVNAFGGLSNLTTTTFTPTPPLAPLRASSR